MKFRRPRTPLFLRRIFHRKSGEGEFFALWPRRTENGTWVWLERVTRYRTYHGRR